MYRTEILDSNAFSSLHEVRTVSDDWGRRHNLEGLHESLGDVPPSDVRSEANQHPGVPGSTVYLTGGLPTRIHPQPVRCLQLPSQEPRFPFRVQKPSR